MCIAYVLIKLWTGKFFGSLAQSSDANYASNLTIYRRYNY